MMTKGTAHLPGSFFRKTLLFEICLVSDHCKEILHSTIHDREQHEYRSESD